jgi:site-specific recombinase XerD
MSNQILAKAGDHLKRFEDYLRSIDTSENTVEAYARDARQFLKFLEDEGADIRDVDEEMLFRFLQKLTEREHTGTTKRRMMEGV